MNMKNLNIMPTDESPKVHFDNESGTFELIGKSLPEDVSTFYEPVLEWLEKYKKQPAVETTFIMKLTYFNTASSKLLLDILMILEEIHEKGNKVLVKWYYPDYDEDMKDAGEEYNDMVEVPFEHIVYSPGENQDS